MKRILLVLLVLLVGLMFVGVKFASAEGEGPSLGKAWREYNQASALIAAKDDNNDWKYDQDKIDANGDAASTLLSAALGDITLATDPKAMSEYGQKSMKHLQYLIARAQQAITNGADSFDATPTPVPVAVVPTGTVTTVVVVTPVATVKK